MRVDAADIRGGEVKRTSACCVREHRPSRRPPSDFSRRPLPRTTRHAIAGAKEHISVKAQCKHEVGYGASSLLLLRPLQSSKWRVKRFFRWKRSKDTTHQTTAGLSSTARFGILRTLRLSIQVVARVSAILMATSQWSVANVAQSSGSMPVTMQRPLIQPTTLLPSYRITSTLRS